LLADTDTTDIVVLGAGAAGLMCALTAAQRGRRVLVLEKANKVGKKILMSGGGRCNFTNLYVEADNYIGANPHFCKSALKRYTQWDFINLVERYEIPYEERKHGQLFCINSARDILDMLLAECEQAGVRILTHVETASVRRLEAADDDDGSPTVQRDNSRFQLLMQRKDEQQLLGCRSLVIATGALSIPTLGGSDMGYELARQFGLTVTERRAGLVPFMFSDSIRELCQRLSGVSLPVEVSCGGQAFAEDLLFTHRGISGPVVLQASNYWQPGAPIDIDLLPGMEVGSWLLAARDERGGGLMKTTLARRLPKALVLELQELWWPELKEKPLAEWRTSRLEQLGRKLNQWTLKPSATEGYRTAEVTLGGVDTDQLSSRTMEVKHCPGLYFIGEVVDVTGHLGGFNFQWAWSSGFSAGLQA
jgi:predicted Rossmann fold flavoprotein